MDMKKIGKNIFKARKAANLKQLELAQELGYSRPTITQWENGKNRISIEDLFRVAEICKVNPASLIDIQYDTTEDMPDVIIKTIEVINSGTEYSDALTSNIYAFHKAVISENKMEIMGTNINDLQSRLVQLESRLTVMQKGGAPPALGLRSGGASLVGPKKLSPVNRKHNIPSNHDD